MKRRYLIGILVICMLSVASFALAAQPISLIVNGQTVQCDVPPEIINGRTMVPIRAVAEALGCQVSWDATQNAVVITSAGQTSTIPNQQPSSNASIGTTRDNPLPAGQSLLTPDGFQVTMNSLVEGDAAWSIILNANQFNTPPDSNSKYVLISVDVKNISSQQEPQHISNFDFSLVGSSNKVFHSFDKAVTLSNQGAYVTLGADLYHGGDATGTIAFYVPSLDFHGVI